MTSTTKLSERYRCSKRGCRRRFRVKRGQTKPLQCPSCGALTVFSIEAERQRSAGRQGTCTCGGYPFPHRTGSLPFCYHWTGEPPDEQDWLDYQRTLATERSSI